MHVYDGQEKSLTSIFTARISLTALFTKLSTNSFQNLFEVPQVHYELSHFIVTVVTVVKLVKAQTSEHGGEFLCQLSFQVVNIDVTEVRGHFNHSLQPC